MKVVVHNIPEDRDVLSAEFVLPACCSCSPSSVVLSRLSVVALAKTFLRPLSIQEMLEENQQLKAKLREQSEHIFFLENQMQHRQVEDQVSREMEGEGESFMLSSSQQWRSMSNVEDPFGGGANKSRWEFSVESNVTFRDRISVYLYSKGPSKFYSVNLNPSFLGPFD